MDKQPPQQPTEFFVRYADGSQFSSDETPEPVSIPDPQFNDINSDVVRKNLAQALQDLGSDSSDGRESPSGASASGEESSDKEQDWSTFAQHSKKLIDQSEALRNWVNSNQEQEQKNHQRKVEQAAKTVTGILTVMKQKNIELHNLLTDRINSTTAAILSINQQQNEQQKSLLKDIKLEQQAIKDEFKTQYDKCYSNLCAAVAQINKQQATAKDGFKQEITQLRSYIKWLSVSFATVVCGFLAWIHLNTK